MKKHIEINGKEAARLHVELDEAIRKYDELMGTLGLRLKTLEDETVVFNAENVKFVAEINSLNPDYEELCRVFAEKSKDYDEIRKRLICKHTFVYI